MQVKMKKFVFVGTQQSNEAFFEEAQKFGCFEFIKQPGNRPYYFPKPIENLKEALKTLRNQPVRSQEWESYDKAPQIVGEILGLKKDLETLSEELRQLKAEILKVEPLGRFNLEDFENLKEQSRLHFQFFMMQHERLKQKEVPGELIFINRAYDFDYYMYIGAGPFEHPAFNEVYIRQDLSSLYANLKRLKQIIHQKESDLKQKAIYIDFLQDYMLFEMNKISLEFARNDIERYLGDQLFAITCWVPKNKAHRVLEVTKKFSVIGQEVKIEPIDEPPTLLENKGLAEVGQDLVEVYDTPMTQDPDPSVWVVWAFAIFFGIIVSDAGYGVLYLLLALYLRFKFPDVKPVFKRVIKLITFLSLTTIGWGVLVGSYFSIELEPTSYLNRISLLYQMGLEQVSYHFTMGTKVYKDWLVKFPTISEAIDPVRIMENGYKLKDGKKIYELMKGVYDSILLELALFFGIIHLSISFLRNIRRSWSGIGWVSALWGGFFFFPKVIGATSMVQYLGWMNSTDACYVGQQMLYGGLVVALVLGILQHKLAGLATIFKVIEVFADTLSYLRLYALGLASMVLASTFNELGGMFGGYFFGAIIIVLGHCVNISLGLMAAVIHGLRLNFLEWYHHCFEGGGRKFNPLRNFVRE